MLEHELSLPGLSEVLDRECSSVHEETLIKTCQIFKVFPEEKSS